MLGSWLEGQGAGTPMQGAGVYLVVDDVDTTTRRRSRTVPTSSTALRTRSSARGATGRVTRRATSGAWDLSAGTELVLGPGVPGLQRRQRVERVAAVVPARRAPTARSAGGSRWRCRCRPPRRCAGRCTRGRPRGTGRARPCACRRSRGRRSGAVDHQVVAGRRVVAAVLAPCRRAPPPCGCRTWRTRPGPGGCGPSARCRSARPRRRSRGGRGSGRCGRRGRRRRGCTSPAWELEALAPPGAGGRQPERVAARRGAGPAQPAVPGHARHRTRRRGLGASSVLTTAAVAARTSST